MSQSLLELAVLSLQELYPNDGEIAIAELAQLHDTIAALEDRITLLEDASETARKLAQLEIDYCALEVAHDALEAAVSEALEAIDDAVKHHCGGTKQLRAWLAAHAEAQKGDGR